ncbi:MAG: LutC/YkgG family protein [Terriglobia bacterium]
MSSKEQMLERVRHALGRSAGAGGSTRAELPEAGRVLAPIPAGGLVDHFEKELRALSGVAYRAGSMAELEAILMQILPPAGATVMLSRNPLLARLGIAQRLEAYRCLSWTDPGAAADREEFRRLCFAASVGMTGADFALAESGTLVLTSAIEGSQLVSLAPPVHVALYTRSQVVESLEEVLEGLQPARAEERHVCGRSAVFVSGPSRTADIEQISIRGVHGPVQVHAILVEESCLQTSA